MSDSKTPLYLIDGSSYLYRAYMVMQDLQTSDGKHYTGAMFGVLNMIRRLLNEADPERLAMIFDAPGKNFRHEMYPEYKANRPPMPAELKQQIEPLLEIIETMGIPVVRVPDVEADDVIGTLATQYAARDIPVIISTGDKDMAQLVNDRVELVNTMTDTRLDTEGVKEKFGVTPDQIIDYLALVGDKVDNVPGVNKCGPKTAAKWLGQYQTMDKLLEHSDEIGGKIGGYLREAADHLPLSRDLVTIRTGLDLSLGDEDLTRQPADNDRLRDLFETYEFRTWLRQLDQEEGVTPAIAEQDLEYAVIQKRAELDDWIERLADAGVFALDCETTSLDALRADLVGISIASEAGSAAYIPLTHADESEQLGIAEVIESLNTLTRRRDIQVIAQNAQYDMQVLERYGLVFDCQMHDTMLESYVYQSTATRHDMDSLARFYLDSTTIKYEEIAGKGAKQLTFDQIPLDTAAEYAAEDAEITLRLHQHLNPMLQQDSALNSVYSDIEMPLIPVLNRMKTAGIRVDTGLLDQMSSELQSRAIELEIKAHEIAGRSFNLGSPKQLQEILFEQQGLPVIRKTPKGQPSTAEDVLEQLAHEYELPEVILEYRTVSKLKSTYTDKLPLCVNPDTGRIHTSYHQAVAATGRLSSNDPNLQNIPIRRAEGRRIREAFVPDDGFVLMAADYSQIELRIMAHLSRDKGLLSAFEKGLDIHASTAAEVFGGTPDSVSKDDRRAAKAINFGLIYGMSSFGLGKQLGISRAEAQEYIDTYFARYPGVREYMDNTRQQAHEAGYVETIFGRRLHLKEINSSNFQRRQGAERAAINAPMQGSAADIIKLAMIAVDSFIREQHEGEARMLLQVHDELVLEVVESQLDAVAEGVNRCMRDAASLDVDLVVDIGHGANWNEAH